MAICQNFSYQIYFGAFFVIFYVNNLNATIYTIIATLIKQFYFFKLKIFVEGGENMIEERKEIITVRDMMEMLDCSYDTACKRLREVKAVSNLLDLRGKVHRKDWERYLNRFNNSEETKK